MAAIMVISTRATANTTTAAITSATIATMPLIQESAFLVKLW